MTGTAKRGLIGWWRRRRARRLVSGDGGASALVVVVAALVFVGVVFVPMRAHLEAIAAATAPVPAVDPDAPPEPPARVGAGTVVYATLQLLTLDAPALEAVETPPWLAVARLLAPVFGALTFLASLNRVVRARVRARTVRWLRGHEVRCFDEQEAIRWARGRLAGVDVTGASRTVVVMPSVSEDVRRELSLLGVRPVIVPTPDSRRGPYANAVSGAETVVVDLADDVETLKYALAAREVGRAGTGRSGPRSIVAYVASPTLELLSTTINDDRSEEDGLAQISVTSNERQLVRSMQIHRIAQRPRVGSLHLAIAGGGPSMAQILDGIVATVEPAEAAKVTLFLPPGTPAPPSTDRLEVVPKLVPVESMAQEIHELSRRLAADPKVADLASPILVHLDDAVRSLLVVAGLAPLRDVGQRIAVVPPTGPDGDHLLLEEFLDGGEQLGSLRVIRATDVGAHARLDEVHTALVGSIRAWGHPGVCGRHPAVELRELLGGRSRDRSDPFPTHVLQNALLSLQESGLTLRRRPANGSVRPLYALGHHVDVLAKGLGLQHLVDRDESRTGDGVRGRIALARFISELNQLVVAGCDLIFEANDAAPRPTWLEDDRVRSLGRAIHDRYRELLPSHDRGRDSDVEWEELAEVFHESNFAQARRIPIKVAALGLELAPLAGSVDATWPAGFGPTDVQLDALGELEHQLWAATLFSRGVQYGMRGVSSEHPDLRSYAELSRETQEKDLSTVRDLPSVLAGAGLRLVRAAGKRVGPA